MGDTKAYKWEDVPLGEEMGPRGSRGTVRNKQGLSLASYFWPAQTPKAVILIVHGHGCHLPYEFLKSQGAGKYKIYSGSWVEAWNNAGYSVCGIDTQSHGRSEGARGLSWFFESFDDLVDDVLRFRREEIPKTDGFKDLPVFMCGISMGGCLSVCAMHKAWEEGDFKGAVLLAPMLSLERVSRQPINRILRPISAFVNIIAPTLAIVKVAQNTMFPELQEEFDIDPFTSGGTNTRVRVACEYLSVTAWIMSNLSKMRFDFIAFHSDKDMMCDPDGSKALFEQSTSSNKMLTSVNGMWHFLTKEDGNMNVLKSAMSWTDARLSEGSNQM